MAKTVVGLFDDEREAQRAVRALLNGGVAREDIGITANNYSGGESDARAADADEGLGDKIANFFGSLFGDEGDERAGYYSEAVRRGGTVVTVDADTDELAERAASILDQYGAVDVNERGTEYRAGGYGGFDRGGAAYTAEESAAERGRYRAGREEGGEGALPVVEEQLQVGKREVERGGVRLRSHIVERPVEEAVRLREERVKVERRPVNRPVDENYLNAFQEGTVEVKETAEVPVVSKQARVVEEVVVNKEAGERTETVRDTVRRSDVEVEKLDADDAKRNRAKGSGSR